MYLSIIVDGFGVQALQPNIGIIYGLGTGGLNQDRLNKCYSLDVEKKNISACNLSPRIHFFPITFFPPTFIFFLLIYFFHLLLCRWFCHFDDDNYVNVPRLVDKLSQFDHRKDWYLGKPSLPEPLEILDRDNNHQQVRNLQFIYQDSQVLAPVFCFAELV